MIPADRKRLAALLRRELEEPRPWPELVTELAPLAPALELVRRLVEAKDEAHRTSFYLRSQHAWFRRFGWRILRPLFVVAVLGAIGFSLQHTVDPTVGVACFIGGLASLHVVIQLFAQHWADKELKRLPETEERYRSKLRTLLEELEGK